MWNDPIITRIVKPGRCDQISLLCKSWYPVVKEFIDLRRFLLFNIKIKTDAPFFEIWFSNGLNESRWFYQEKEFKTDKDKVLYEYLCLNQIVIDEDTIIGVDMKGFYDFSLKLENSNGFSVETTIHSSATDIFNQICESIIKITDIKNVLLARRNEIERYDRFYKNIKH